MDETHEVEYIHKHSYRAKGHKLTSLPEVQFMLYLADRQDLLVLIRGAIKSTVYRAIESETMDAIRTQMRQANCHFTEASLENIVLIHIHAVYEEIKRTT